MATSAFTPPKFAPSEANVCASWKSYKEEVLNYFVAADLENASGARKVAILLYSMGPRYRDIFDTFSLNAEGKKDYAQVIAKFDRYFEPKRVVKLYMKQFDACVQRSSIYELGMIR